MTTSGTLAMLSSAVGRVEKVFVFVAVFSSIAIMLIISLDTVLRYVFRSPLLWSIDVVSRYLMVAVFYMAISYAFQQGDHIRLLAFRRMIGRRLKAVADILIYGAAMLIFATIGLRMFSVMTAQWRSGESFIGVYLYPNWITSALIAFGCLLLTLRLLVRTLQRLNDFADGREDAELQGEKIEELAV